MQVFKSSYFWSFLLQDLQRKEILFSRCFSMTKTQATYHPLLAISIQTGLIPKCKLQKNWRLEMSPHFMTILISSYTPGSHWLFWRIPYLSELWKDSKMRIRWTAHKALHDPCELSVSTHPQLPPLSQNHTIHMQKNEWAKKKKMPKMLSCGLCPSKHKLFSAQKINHPLITYLGNRVNTDVQIKSYCQRESSVIHF